MCIRFRESSFFRKNEHKIWVMQSSVSFCRSRHALSCGIGVIANSFGRTVRVDAFSELCNDDWPPRRKPGQNLDKKYLIFEKIMNEPCKVCSPSEYRSPIMTLKESRSVSWWGWPEDALLGSVRRDRRLRQSTRFSSSARGVSSEIEDSSYVIACLLACLLACFDTAEDESSKLCQNVVRQLGRLS